MSLSATELAQKLRDACPVTQDMVSTEIADNYTEAADALDALAARIDALEASVNAANAMVVDLVTCAEDLEDRGAKRDAEPILAKVSAFQAARDLAKNE